MSVWLFLFINVFLAVRIDTHFYNTTISILVLIHIVSVFKVHSFNKDKVVQCRQRDKRQSIMPKANVTNMSQCFFWRT